MNIAIIGAGFTGLSAGYSLLKKGHRVTIIERATQPGGLALGFQEKKWAWTLEEHYHHWFTNDGSILQLAQELDYPVTVRRPKTSILVDQGIFQFDSPGKVLSFPHLSPLEKIRMATTLGIIRLNPFWKPLEKIHASSILPKLMGKRGYEMIWEPQFTNKFGPYTPEISLAWFWARLTKRTADLAYPEKGFLAFAKHVSTAIQDRGGVIHYSAETKRIHQKKDKKIYITYQLDGKTQTQSFDKTIVTLPTPAFTAITDGLPSSYTSSLKRLHGLGAINVILRLKKPFLKNNTYWLSVCKKNSPVMAVVEHTNFMDKKHYNNEHLVYVGNYLQPNHRYFSLSARQLLKEYHPFLESLNPSYKKSLIDVHVFKAPFAQPIIPVNYSTFVPTHITPIENVFLANMQQVYPWDRGTNYAVELGQKVAKIVAETQ